MSHLALDPHMLVWWFVDDLIADDAAQAVSDPTYQAHVSNASERVIERTREIPGCKIRLVTPSFRSSMSHPATTTVRQ